jgi:hypothetical protein
VYYTKFDSALNRQGSAASLLVQGARPALTDAATEKISCSAATDDTVNDSIWGIHAVPDTSGWSFAVAQFR